MIGKMRMVPLVAVLTLVALLASGCMYRSEIERQLVNPAVIREEVNRVQGAVDAYMKDHSAPPVRTSNSSTPEYERYIIDFRKLVGLKYLSSVPQNAFENGGNYYYVLTEAKGEEGPKVKLLDLVAFTAASDVERSVAQYARENGGSLPLGPKVAEGFYAIDFKALGIKPVQVRSAFSEQFLPLLLHESGAVGIDYGMEIMKALQKNGSESGSAAGTPTAEEDLRERLVQDSFFVPVRSFPYRWKDDQPIVEWGNR